MKPLDALLVDDDSNDCALFGLAVERTGLNILLQTAPGGEQAIDYLEGRGAYADRSIHPLPDLVVLDLDMRVGARLPGYSGPCPWLFLAALPTKAR